MEIGWLAFLIIALIGAVLAWYKQRSSPAQTRRSWRELFSGLQWRMTFSYVWITIPSVIIFLLLASPARIWFAPLLLTVVLLFWFRNWIKHRKEAQKDKDWRSRGLVGFFPPLSVWICASLLLLLVMLLSEVGVLVGQGSGFDQVSELVHERQTVEHVAQHYASTIQQQSQGKLGNTFPYPLGQPLTINPDKYIDKDASAFLQSATVPYLPRLYPSSQAVTFALLVAPSGRILSSSYPARYALGSSVLTILPVQSPLIQQAFHDQDQSGMLTVGSSTMVYSVVHIVDHDQTTGVVYVQVPETTLQATPPGWFASLQNSFLATLVITIMLLIVLAPLGGIYGFISTRSLVRRLKMLASATTLVANGDYHQRLPVASKDEIGQLEQQFNRMTEQLGESINRQKVLAEQNARLAERSRISRELHDAISQDLFSLSLLAGGLQGALPADSPLQRQVSILEQTTINTVREMRALLLELRPTRLEQLGLIEALDELATAYSTRLSIHVCTELIPLQLEARYEHTLLRIAQEALANAARHANATEIVMKLSVEEGNIIFCISDNGHGFQPNSEHLRHGLGLRMMQERVGELHGTLTLTSVPDQGTQLEIHLPQEEL